MTIRKRFKRLTSLMLATCMMFPSMGGISLAANVKAEEMKAEEVQVLKDDDVSPDDKLIEDIIVTDTQVIEHPESTQSDNMRENLNSDKFTYSNIKQWHDAGYTGKGLRVAIYDHLVDEDYFRKLGYNVTNETKGHEDDTFEFDRTHGNVVFHTMAQIIPDAEFHIYSSRRLTSSKNMLIDSLEEPFDVLNISYTNFWLSEALAHLVDEGTSVFKSGGNTTYKDFDAQDDIPLRQVAFNVAAMHNDKGSLDKISESYYGQLSNKLDVAAFSGIETTQLKENGDEVKTRSVGTSLSAPYAAGMTGLFKQRFEEVEGRKPTPAEVVDFFDNNCYSIEETEKKTGLTYQRHENKYKYKNRKYEDYTDKQRFGRGFLIMPDPKDVKAPKNGGGYQEKLDIEWPASYVPAFGFDHAIRINQKSNTKYMTELNRELKKVIKIDSLRDLEEFEKDFKSESFRSGFPFTKTDSGRINEEIKKKDKIKERNKPLIDIVNRWNKSIDKYDGKLQGDAAKKFDTLSKYNEFVNTKTLSKDINTVTINKVAKAEKLFNDVVKDGLDGKDTTKHDIKFNHKPLLVGYPDGTIKPDDKITREEAASIINRSIIKNQSKNKSFIDVKEKRWSYEAINNINVDGYSNGRFKPYNNITRAEALTMINNNLDYSTNTTKKKVNFKDINKHWAKDNIIKANQKGIIEGYGDKTFKPDQPITRAEFIVMINNADRQCIDYMYRSYDYVKKYRKEIDHHWAYKYLLEALIPHDPYFM